MDNEMSKDLSYKSFSPIQVHKKLKDISQKTLSHLLKHGMILDIELDSIGEKITCDVCIKSKITCKFLPKDSGERAKKLGEKIYSDVWGPSRHITTDKKLYYVSFIDDYSRELVIYLMSLKDQVFAKYKLYEAMMSWQRDVCIKTLFSDRGDEYTSKEFEEYLAEKGTKHRLTMYDTPEQNGVAEQLN